MSEVVDNVNVGTALHLLNSKSDPPMATCPRDGEPLICTLEFPGAEFICVICDTTYGFLSPAPAKWTPELQARHDELSEVYEKAREARRER